MKLLHTADWHIGKLLSDKSRLEEQQIVLQELVELAEQQEVDVICIAGDIYDNGSPSAKAEELFCSTIEELSKGGSRLVIIIAGNHDKPERLEALRPLAQRLGILIFGTPLSEIETGEYGDFRVINKAPGVIEVTIGEEQVVISCVPYTTEKLLGEVIYRQEESEEEQMQSYEQRIKVLYDRCNEFYREDTVNICMSHVFTVGYQGDSSERSTQLGGSYLLNASVFPKMAQYIALGHVHRPQKVAGSGGKARYSGSLLPYHSDEVKIAKQCNLVELHAGEEPVVTPLLLSNPKPIERWNCNGIEEAREKCKSNQDRECWVFLKIKTKEIILEDEIKELKSLKKDLIEITPIPTDSKEEGEEEVLRQEENVTQLFQSFYKSMKGIEASEEMIALLQKLTGEEAHETVETYH